MKVNNLPPNHDVELEKVQSLIVKLLSSYEKITPNIN